MAYKRVVLTKFGGPEVLEVVEAPTLPEPGPNEVRIKVLATSACFTDTVIRRGLYPELKGKKPPFSLGYDMVGRVDKVGAAVQQFRKGDKVADLTVTGAYAEYICLHQDRLVPVPDGLSAPDAVSMILSYLTAYQVMFRYAAVSEGQKILITGAAGAVGTALMQLGQHYGLQMFGTASKQQHGHLEAHGTIPIDYKRENILQRIRDLVGPAGLDAAFDGVGGKSLGQSRKALKKNGVLVPYGFAGAKTTLQGIRVLLDLQLIRWKFWKLFSNKNVTQLYSIGKQRTDREDWFKEDLTDLFRLLEAGHISPVIEEIIPFTEARRAHELLQKGGIKGKIVLRVNPE